MTSFQTMIAVPQEEYLTMTAVQNAKAPLAQQFYKLENRYTTQQEETDPLRRLALQSNTLDEMKQLKEQMQNSLTVATPKPYVNRAKALFESMGSFLKYNEKGEMYTDDGKLIPGSRLEDLIQHAVRDRRRNMTPTGWTDFLAMLRSHNIPKSILNRSTLDELEGKSTPLPTIKEEATTSVPKPTKLVKPQVKPRIQPKREEKDAALSFLKYYK